MMESTSLKLELHPLCEVIPAMSDESLTDLVEDIKKNGQHDPIVLFDGKILDGRSRYAACTQAGVVPRTVAFSSVCPKANTLGTPQEKEDLAFSWVISRNLHRRHLNESQRALVAAKVIAKKNTTIPAAATQLNVSSSQVSQAKKALQELPVETVKEIEQGKKSLHAALKEVPSPKEDLLEKQKAEAEAYKKKLQQGAVTQKEFRKKVSEFQTLITNSNLVSLLVELVETNVAVETLNNCITLLSKHASMPIRVLETKRDSLKEAANNVHAACAAAIKFQLETSQTWLVSLRQAATCEEDLQLLNTAQQSLKEMTANSRQALMVTAKQKRQTSTIVPAEVAALSYVSGLSYDLAKK